MKTKCCLSSAFLRELRKKCDFMGGWKIPFFPVNVVIIISLGQGTNNPDIGSKRKERYHLNLCCQPPRLVKLQVVVLLARSEKVPLPIVAVGDKACFFSTKYSGVWVTNQIYRRILNWFVRPSRSYAIHKETEKKICYCLFCANNLMYSSI